MTSASRHLQDFLLGDDEDLVAPPRQHVGIAGERAPAVAGEPLLQAVRIAFQLPGVLSGNGLPSDAEGAGTPSRPASVGAMSATSTRVSMRPALTHAGP